MFEDLEIIRLTGTGFLGTLFTSEFDAGVAGTAAISVQTYYVAAALVRRGVGIAVVDEFTARASLTDDLDFRPFAKPALFDIYCVHLEERPLSRISRDFIADLEHAIETARS
jgi:DNA-binding transcriptional LysR family regulator